MGKGEIARYEQFLLFPQCFQNLSVVDASKYLWIKGLKLAKCEGLSKLQGFLDHFSNTDKKTRFSKKGSKHRGKGEINNYQPKIRAVEIIVEKGRKCW